MADWEKVGIIGVDAGCVMVGDPCYTQGADATDAATDWEDFLAKTWPNVWGPDAILGAQPDQIASAMGSPTTGIVVSSGYGDGAYPVYVKRSGDRIAAVKVVFIDPDEDEEDMGW